MNSERDREMEIERKCNETASCHTCDDLNRINKLHVEQLNIFTLNRLHLEDEKLYVDLDSNALLRDEYGFWALSSDTSNSQEYYAQKDERPDCYCKTAIYVEQIMTR